MDQIVWVREIMSSTRPITNLIVQKDFFQWVHLPCCVACVSRRSVWCLKSRCRSLPRLPQQSPVLSLMVTTIYLGSICSYTLKIGWELSCQIGNHKRVHWDRLKERLERPCLSKWLLLSQSPAPVLGKHVLLETSLPQSGCFYLNVIRGPSHFHRISDWPQ